VSLQRAYTEKDAASCFKQVLEAVGHMHSRGIVHCDLKPENILYEDDTDRQIKIADFGFAQFMPGGEEGGEMLSKQLGTLSYTAPEILAGTGYDTKADMWSLGVILYILLSGIPPFGKRRGETDRDVKRNILRGNFRFYESHWKDVSSLAVDFVKKLIVVSPKERLNYEQALEHPWIQVFCRPLSNLSNPAASCYPHCPFPPTPFHATSIPCPNFPSSHSPTCVAFLS
jgi:serine/threonine protein kinase